MEDNKTKEFTITHHLLLYIISFFGLFIAINLCAEILSLFPSITGASPAMQSTILTASAYFLVLVGCIAFIWNTILKDIIMQFKDLKKLVDGFIYGVILIAGTIFIALICSSIAELLDVSVVPNDNESAIRENTLASPVLSAMTSVIFAPIVEELGYRVGLFGGICKYNRKASYVISALVFAFIHFNFQSPNLLNELINLPPYIFAGVWLCYTYDRHQSVAVSMVAHATNNAYAFIATLINSGL